ncbi:uncharacterized protein BDR25DRAFT_237190, partial [Lindgomyces ingoldianus]
FAGSNEYFLHALPATDQQVYVETLAGWGVLSGVLTGVLVTYTDGGCLKGSTDVLVVPPLESMVGTYDTTVLTALDDTLKILSSNGIKAIISPHNANSLTGDERCDAYCKKFTNASTVYSSAEAKADYDNRLAAILSYESPNFGKQWRDLRDVILAFNLQNEPLIKQNDKLSANDPDDWLWGRAGVLRGLLGASDTKVATGGIGGSQYCCDKIHQSNLLTKALEYDAIDIMSVHGYINKASDWAYFITGEQSILAQANIAGEHVTVEERGVSTSYQDDFDIQLTALEVYWQVVPGLDASQEGSPSDCGYDRYEIGVNSSKGDIASAVAAANAARANQSWDGYVY